MATKSTHCMKRSAVHIFPS